VADHFKKTSHIHRLLTKSKEMKKTILLLLIIPTFCFAQNNEYSIGFTKADSAFNITHFGTFPHDIKIYTFPKPLDEQYLDWCEANKVLVGYTFYLSKDNTKELFPKKNCKGDTIGWENQVISTMSVHFDNPHYLSYFEESESRPNFLYNVDWENPNNVWYVARICKKVNEKEKFIEAVPIKMSQKPTFEGFVKWKKERMSKYL
jgi:hypothetical protein